MARFYQTTQRNFQDDFIFQPDMNLAMMALAKKDNDIKDQMETLDLFENLPVDYWKDADQENVKAIKADYEDRVSKIATQMQGDLTNTGANQRAINNLRRQIENDYEFGQIRNIQENAKAYKQFDAMIKAMPNPADREGYKKMVNKYLEGTEGKGALSSVFKPEELYNSRDLWGEFTQSAAFKNLKPDERSSQATKIGGQWIMKEGSQSVALSESKIGQAFKTFIDSNNLGGYGKSRQDYFDEQWLDAEGNVRMDGDSYLGNLVASGIPSLAYSNKSSSSDAQANPYGMAKFNSNLQEGVQIRAEKRAAEAAKVSALIAGVDISDIKPNSKVAELLGASEFLQQRLRSKVGNLAGVLFPGTNSMNNSQRITNEKAAMYKILSDKKLQKDYPNTYKNIKSFYDNEMQPARQANRAFISAIYGGDKTKTDDYFKKVAGIATYNNNVKLYTPRISGNTDSKMGIYNFNELNSGKATIQGNKVLAGSVKLDADNAMSTEVIGSMQPQDGTTVIPITYEYADKEGNPVETTGYIYASNKNFM